MTCYDSLYMPYRGNTEQERIECALHVQNIDEMGFYLARAQLLTENKAQTLQFCRSMFIIGEEEEYEPGPEPVTRVQTPAREPEPEPAAVIPPKKRTTIRQVE